LLLAGSAVFCVAILNANPVWVVAARGVALVSLLFALLAIWYRREDKRAYWVGYLHGGGAYALLMMYSLGGFSQAPIWNDRQIVSGEIATAVYRLLPEGKRRAEWDSLKTATTQHLRVRLLMGEPIPAPAPPDFRYLFHAAFIVLCGWIGGLVGVWLYRTRDAKPAGRASDTNPKR
jgi:hypothetical protein